MMELITDNNNVYACYSFNTNPILVTCTGVITVKYLIAYFNLKKAYNKNEVNLINTSLLNALKEEKKDFKDQKCLEYAYNISNLQKFQEDLSIVLKKLEEKLKSLKYFNDKQFNGLFTMIESSYSYLSFKNISEMIKDILIIYKKYNSLKDTKEKEVKEKDKEN